MWLFTRKQENILRETPGFEETERRTPKTGVILLLLMFVAGVFFGWRALDNLAWIPSLPAPLSPCSYRYGSVSGTALGSPLSNYSYISSLYGGHGDDSARCQFNDLEKQYDIPAQIEKRIIVEEKLKEISNKSDPTSRQLNDIRREIQNFERQYNLGLQEHQAGIPQQIFPVTPQVQENLRQLRFEENVLQAQLAALSAKRSVAQSEIEAIDRIIQKVYVPVFEAHNRRLRFFEFKIFLLQFFLVFPLFIFSIYQYLRLLRRNSPYAIIFTGVVGVTGILSLRVLLFWFWGLFLARLMEILFRWFAQFEIIRSMVFYGGMILSFLIFGGAVYYLQKRIFDPRRVIIRRFRAKQCPHCQTDLDLGGLYCPNCGHQIREKCQACGQLRFIGMPACPNCGFKKEA